MIAKHQLRTNSNPSVDIKLLQFTLVPLFFGLLDAQFPI